MTIYNKLAAVQQALKAPKDQFNSFGKYSYRSCEGILEAVKPLLAKNGLALTLTDSIVEVGGRVYVQAFADLTDVESGEKVAVSALAREEESKKGMDGSQVTGAASSYARKYALNGLFCIDDNKDSDATNTHGKDKPEKTYTCDDCGKTITDWHRKDGTTMTAEEFAMNSLNRYGKILCYDCIKKK